MGGDCQLLRLTRQVDARALTVAYIGSTHAVLGGV